MVSLPTAAPGHRAASGTPVTRWHFAAADGVRLIGDRIACSRPGREVVLAHGFGQTRQAWWRSAASLARAGHASLAFDARGHGQSDRNPSDRPYRPEQFVDDHLGVARAQATAPILVGASMGGLIGLLAQSRERVFSALVLVDITPRWSAGGVERILAFMTAHPDGFEDYQHAAAAIAERLPHRPRKSREQLASLLVESETGRLHWHWDRRLLQDIGREGERLQRELAAATAAIDVPMLLVSGGRSELIEHRHIEEFLDLAPHAEHEHLPAATHMLAGDDNDRFSAAVLRFIERLPTPSGRRAAPSSGASRHPLPRNREADPSTGEHP